MNAVLDGSDGEGELIEFRSARKDATGSGAERVSAAPRRAAGTLAGILDGAAEMSEPEVICSCAGHAAAADA